MFEIKPEVQTLINDATDTAVKSVLLAVGDSGTDAVLAVGEAVKAAVDGAVANNTEVPTAIKVAEGALKTIHDGLTLAGKTALADDVEELEVVVDNFDSNGGNAPLAAVKTWLQKIFAPKKYAAKLAANQ